MVIRKRLCGNQMDDPYMTTLQELFELPVKNDLDESACEKRLAEIIETENGSWKRPLSKNSSSYQ